MERRLGYAPHTAMERLRAVWPHTIVVEREPAGGLVDAAADRAHLAGTGDPIEICSAFVEWVDSTCPTRAQRDTLSSALEAVVAEEMTA